MAGQVSSFRGASVLPLPGPKTSPLSTDGEVAASNNGQAPFSADQARATALLSNVKVKVVPSPAIERTVSVAPCARAISLAMYSPRPRPLGED